jgi:hypothetical protein
MDARGLDGFGEGQIQQEGGEVPHQHRLFRPRWRYGQHTCNRHGFTMVTAGACGDLPWLEAQRGTARRECPSDRMVMSQYPLGIRGPACPPAGGWPGGVELEPPGVVQADMHTTTAIKTTRMTCVHHVGTVFKLWHMSVSSGVPDGLTGCRLPSACAMEALPG